MLGLLHTQDIRFLQQSNNTINEDRWLWWNCYCFSMVFVGEFVTCVSCRKKTYFVSWERSKVNIVTLRFNKTKGEQVNCCWPKQLYRVDEDAIIKNLRFQKSWGLFLTFIYKQLCSIVSYALQFVEGLLLY